LPACLSAGLRLLARRTHPLLSEEADVEGWRADDPRIGRRLELERLERGERGLARAYRGAGMGAEAALDGEHAHLLRARAEALGGHGSDDTDDDWLSPRIRGAAVLERAEDESIAVYRDHLIDFDVETRALVRNRILPDHERTLAALELGYPRS